MKTVTHFRKFDSLKLLVLLTISLSIFKSYSQGVYYDSLRKQKVLRIEVNKTYERVLAKGYESLEMLEYLGSYYYGLQDFKKSKIYYDRIFKSKKYKKSQVSAKCIEEYEMLVGCL